MKLLLLGGTKDARLLADTFIHAGIEVIYSLQGLVRTPDLACEIIVGGFRARGGLAHFIQTQNIHGVLDATHPYAAQMTQNAVLATKERQIPLWVFHRPAWEPQPDDQWRNVRNWDEALAQCSDAKSVFLSAGQLPEPVVQRIKTTLSGKAFLLRTAVKPKTDLPANVEWLKAIGPFDIKDELALLARYSIDKIISKNSGGESTYAKIVAARQRKTPVVMFERPAHPKQIQIIAGRDACFSVINTYFKEVKENCA